MMYDNSMQGPSASAFTSPEMDPRMLAMLQMMQQRAPAPGSLAPGGMPQPPMQPGMQPGMAPGMAPGMPQPGMPQQGAPGQNAQSIMAKLAALDPEMVKRILAMIASGGGGGMPGAMGGGMQGNAQPMRMMPPLGGNLPAPG